MKTKLLKAKNRRKLSLLLSVTTFFAATFIMSQLMVAPTFVRTVHAGSTLTPTPEPPPPTNTPEPPPPTETPVPPPPTNTPEPSNSGGNNSGGSNQPPAPTPTPTSTPEIPQEIPELGVGSEWQPLFLTMAVMLIALGIAIFQVRHLLSESTEA